MGFGTQVGEAFVELRAKWDKFQSDLDGAATRFEGVGSRLTSLGTSLTTRLTLPILGAGAAAFKMAADANESASKMEAVFGGATQRMNDWLAELRDTVPETTSNLQQMASGIQDLLVPLGMAPDAAEEMTRSVVELAGDLASFNNIPMDQALEKIRAGLVGQNEPLLSFGVALSAATVKARALELGLIAEGEELDANSRAQAAFQLILEGTTAAHGDAARTADSAANSLKFMWAEAKELAATIGQRLIPVVTPMIQRLTEIVQRVQTANPALVDMAIKAAALAAAIGPVLLVVGKVVTVLAALQPWMVAVTAALGVAVLAWKKWGDDITIAVQATVNIVRPVWEEFVGRIVASSQWLHRNALRPIVAFVTEAVTFLVDVFGGVVSKIAQIYMAILRVVNPPLARALDRFGEFVTDVGAEMERLRADSERSSEDTVDEIGNAFSGLGPGPSGAMTGPVRRSVEDVTDQMEVLRRNVINSGRMLHQGQRDIFEDIEDSHGRHWGVMGTQTEDGYAEIFVLTDAIEPELVERMSGPWRRTSEIVKEETRNLRDAVAGRGGLIDEFGGQAGDRFLEIKEDIEGKWGAIKGVIEATIGLENWNAWKEGILGIFRGVSDEAKTVVDTITGAGGAGGGGVTDAAGDLADSVAGGWLGVIIQSISSIVGGAISGIISSRATKQSGQAIVDQLRLEGAHVQAWLLPRVDPIARIAGDVNVALAISRTMEAIAHKQLDALEAIEFNTRGGAGGSSQASIRDTNEALGIRIVDDSQLAGDLSV